MDVEDGIEMIIQIYKKQSEERYFSLYTAIYPNFTDENNQTFEEFYKPVNLNVNNEVVQEKTAEEILNDVKEAMDSNEWG